MITGLDHVVILTGDIHAAAAAYQSRGGSENGTSSRADDSELAEHPHLGGCGFAAIHSFGVVRRDATLPPRLGREDAWS